MFNPENGANSAGIGFVRIPLGSSDHSLSLYSYDDVSSQDPAMQAFTLETLPTDVLEIVCDIQLINPFIKFHFLPWSPPGWMKDSGSLLGGSFLNSSIDAYTKYLFRSIIAWQAKGVSAYCISIQNEPLYNDSTYPTALLSADDEAQIATELRQLLDAQGLTDVKILAYEHNWDNLDYPNSALSNSTAFAGASFHCYEGVVSAMSQFQGDWPNTEVYQTECTGTVGTDWWSDLKWQTEMIWIGSPNNFARTAAMWSLVADPSGGPLLPGTNSCPQGCRGVVSVSGGNYTLNQEFYGLAHANKAILPVDTGGPVGERIQSLMTGASASALFLAAAYRTGRTNTTDPIRYTMVVLNGIDSSSNPGPVDCNIQFRGKYLTYSFPVGLTTLTWYAT